MPGRPTFRSLPRFCRLSVVFALLVILLFVFEGLVLWWVGVHHITATSWRGHSLDFTLSNDGRWAASDFVVQRAAVASSIERDVLLHDMRQGGPTVSLKLTHLQPQGAVMSPDGRYIALISATGAVYLCDIPHCASPQLLARVSGGPLLRPIVWSPDGRYLAGVGRDFIHLWQIDPTALLHKFPHGSRANPAVRISGDSRCLLSGREDGELRIWDITSGELVETALSQSGAIIRVDSSPDGRLVALATAEGEVCVYEMQSRRMLWRRYCWKPPGISFSPDNALLAAIEWKPGNADTICIRCARTGRFRHRVDYAGTLLGIRFGTDGVLYAWDTEGTIVGWNLTTRRQEWHFSSRKWGGRYPRPMTDNR